MDGPDHKASIEPKEFKQMVNLIRNTEIVLGNGQKAPSPSEVKNIRIARKSIVAGTKICRGELLSEENLTVKRPGIGISPMKWNEVIGRKAKMGFEPDDLIVI